MGAPAKSTAGGKKQGMESTSGPEWARGRSRSKIVRSTVAGRGRTSRPPKGHAPANDDTSRLDVKAGPPRYTNKSVKPKLLTAALAAADKRGYQALRVSDITDPAGVTRQAFYAHFRDKRHCLCEALDPRLAAIERMTSEAPEAAATNFSAEWSGHIVGVLDELLGEHFVSGEGTKGRLLEAMSEELQDPPALAGVRIGNLVKAARVPQGDFYRQFSGKRECFAVLYEERLDCLLGAIESAASPPAKDEAPAMARLFRALESEFAADPGNVRLLVLGECELPSPGTDETCGGSRRGALAEGLAGALSRCPGNIRIDHLMVGSLVEVIRSAVLTGSLEGLGERLNAVVGSLSPSPALALAA